MITKQSSPQIFAGKASKKSAASPKAVVPAAPVHGSDEYYAARKAAGNRKSTKPTDFSNLVRDIDYVVIKPDWGFRSNRPPVKKESTSPPTPKKPTKAVRSEKLAQSPQKKPPSKAAVIRNLKQHAKKLPKDSDESLDAIVQLIYFDKKFKVTPAQVIAKARELTDETYSEATASKMIDLFEEVSQKQIRRKPLRVEA